MRVRHHLGITWLLGTVIAISLLPSGAEAAPTATTSRYMSTVENLDVYYLGCDAGNAEEDGATILAFGQADWNGVTYGAYLFNNEFASTSEVGAAAKSWASGYWNCAPSEPFIRVAIGTNNYQGYTEYGHGAAWADMVNDVNDFITSPPSWGSQIVARGASDMEMDWNSPSNTVDWVDGYNDEGEYPLYNFGDAGGCPPYGSCNNGWTQADVVEISFGFALSWPLPEIYCEECSPNDTNGGNAEQWYELSLYSYLYEGGPMYILGSLTQWAASGECCTNTPGDGWQQLYGALNSDPDTSQSLVYSSDITWDN